MLVGVPGQAGLLAPLVHRELQQGLPEAADRGGGHLRLRPHLQPLRHDRVCGLSPSSYRLVTAATTGARTLCKIINPLVSVTPGQPDILLGSVPRRPRQAGARKVLTSNCYNFYHFAFITFSLCVLLSRVSSNHCRNN